MFARKVSLQLKLNSVAEFTQTIEKDIIPLLRKQPGFQDEMVFVVPGGTEAVAISVWDQQEHAEASARGTSPHVLQAVTKEVEGRLRGPPLRWRTRPITRSSLASPPGVDRSCVCGGGGHRRPFSGPAKQHGHI